MAFPYRSGRWIWHPPNPNYIRQYSTFSSTQISDDIHISSQSLRLRKAEAAPPSLPTRWIWNHHPTRLYITTLYHTKPYHIIAYPTMLYFTIQCSDTLHSLLQIWRRHSPLIRGHGLDLPVSLHYITLIYHSLQIYYSILHYTTLHCTALHYTRLD